jgi:hypothetical protein
MAQFGTLTNQEGTLRCHELLLFLLSSYGVLLMSGSGLPLDRN